MSVCSLFLMKAGKDYIGVGCGAFIINEKNEILLMRRGPRSKNRIGHWTIPGGAVEFGETFHSALKREIKEELAIDIEILDHLCLVDDILPEENQHWITPQFLACIVSGEAKITEPEKCDGLAWFRFDALPEPLTIMTVQAIQAFIARNK